VSTKKYEPTNQGDALSEPDIQLLAWAVTTCHMLARRALARSTSVPAQPALEIVRLKALRAVVERLEGARPDDPESPFIGEEVISRSDVLQAIDLFAARAVEAADPVSVPVQPLSESESVAGLPMPPPQSDTEVVIAIRGALWEHMRGRNIGGDRTLVGMVNELARQRDEAEDNRRGEAEMRWALVDQTKSELLSWAASLVRLVCFADLERDVENRIAEPIRDVAMRMKAAAERLSVPVMSPPQEP